MRIKNYLPATAQRWVRDIENRIEKVEKVVVDFREFSRSSRAQFQSISRAIAGLRAQQDLLALNSTAIIHELPEQGTTGSTSGAPIEVTPPDSSQYSGVVQFTLVARGNAGSSGLGSGTVSVIIDIGGGASTFSMSASGDVYPMGMSLEDSTLTIPLDVINDTTIYVYPTTDATASAQPFVFGGLLMVSYKVQPI